MRARSMRKTLGGEDFGGGLRGAQGGRQWTSSGDVLLVPPGTPASQAESGGPPNPTAVIGAYSFCNRGKSGENQDSYVASSSSSGSKVLLGVFDGHGEQGKCVSQFACDEIARTLFAHKDLHTSPASALKAAYLHAQALIEQTHTFDAYHSGTTAVAAYLHRNRLYVANVGDSRAVLGCRQGPDGALRAVDLSSDQRPDREDERRRILAQGGAIHPSGAARQAFGGAARMARHLGPDRVWDRSGRCGLCVTRSLGDIGMRPFVVATPEVSERVLTSRDRILILGSDGVFDKVGSQEAVDLAVRHRDPTMAAHAIASLARQRWHAHTLGQVSDDITAVVLRLDHDAAGPQRSTPPTGDQAHVPELRGAAHAVGARAIGTAPAAELPRRGRAAGGPTLEPLRPASSASIEPPGRGHAAGVTHLGGRLPPLAGALHGTLVAGRVERSRRL